MPRRTLLRSWLHALAPVDEAEREHLARMLALLDAGTDPFSRASYTPGHFTASAFVLAPDAPELLLIFHGKLERWLQPGGHIEPGDEDVLASAKREVREEVGIEAAALELAEPGIFDVDVHVIPARKDAPAHSHFDVRFLFRARSRDFAAGDEVRDARWTPLDALASTETDESVRRAARKLLAQRRGA
jgi:8-oxo-dGTP pyrophosphatase MutT (NUDIX family)